MMRFLLVDDEPMALDSLKLCLDALYPEAEKVCANTCIEALKHRKEHFTAAFLDVEMPGMNGLEIADELMKDDPKLNVIFVTAYAQYAMDAIKRHVSGYITKPFRTEDILREMGDLRYPPEEEAEPKLLRVQCFGTFEIFRGNEPLHFERKIAREVLAYLIHLRGASATRKEICSILWSDSVEIERKKGYFRSLMASLRSTLRNYDSEELLICTRDTYSINPALLDCDYYRFLEGDPAPEVRFRGAYMSQFEWAEEMIYSLMNQNK